MSAEQLTFDGKPEPVGPAEDEIPADVRDALNIVTGNAPVSGMGSESQPPTSEQQDFIKSGMLKKSDRVEKFIRFEGAKVEVFDISDSEQAAKMAEVINLVGDPRNEIEGHWTLPQTMIDPAAPRGFRTIVTVKYWKVVKDARMAGKSSGHVPSIQQPVKFDTQPGAESGDGPVSPR